MRQPKIDPAAAKGARRTDAAKHAPRDPLRPRKQPSQARAAATVSAILEAAACILETGGFDAYTTNAIAERAGASIGSLYQYFPNKTALTQALIAREDAVLLTNLETLLERPDGPELLRELIAIAVAHQLRRPVLARLLDAEEARLPAGDLAPRLADTVSTVLRRCIGDTLIDREPYLAQDLFAIVHGMVDSAGQSGEQDGEALAARVERAVFGYLETFALEDENCAAGTLFEIPHSGTLNARKIGRKVAVKNAGSRSEASEAIHNAASGLYRAKVIDKTTMREYDQLRIDEAPELDPQEIARIRKNMNVSQGVFALYLNTTVSTIRQWEQGDKKPSGIAARMLELVQRNGLAIFD